EDECLVYAPMICEGSAETLSAILIDLRRPERDFGKRYGCLLSCLKDLGIDLRPLYCGGRSSYVQQAREQWTDGANSFTLRPGCIIVYDRNTATAEELDKNGYQVLGPKELVKNG